MFPFQRQSSRTITTRRPSRHLVHSLLAALVLPGAALASDSAWLIGDDGHVVVNILEHREGMGRQTEVTLIYGMHFLQGALHDVNAGKIVLKEMAGGKAGYVYTGSISVDYMKNQITLKGKLTDGDAQHTIIATYDTQLKAKEIEAGM